MEVLVAIIIVSFLFVSLYVGISQGFGIVQLARENLRATQILQEEIEKVRLVKWDDLSTFYPMGPIQKPFYAVGTNQGSLQYTVTVNITNAPVTDSYANDLRLITAVATWASGNVRRERSMATLVSKYGLQHYIY